MAESSTSRGRTDPDPLLELVRQQGENSREMLERLTLLLGEQSHLIGEQLRSRGGELNPEELRLARHYTVLRQQLAGLDEGLVLDVPRVRWLEPESAPVGAVVTLVLAHAGTVEGVTFSGAGQQQVEAVSDVVTGQQVRVKVPEGCVDGPVTVRTSRGDAVSEVVFRVGEVVRPADVQFLVYVR